MGFQVKTTLGQKEILAYQRITARTVQKVKMNVLHWGLIVLGLIGLTTSGAALTMTNFSGGAFFSLSLSMVSFIWGINWYRFQVWKVARNIPANMEQQFMFGEDGMIAKTSSEKVSHRYASFYAIAESRDYYVLFLAKGMGYILDKKGFEIGEAAEFAPFIQEMTGKKLAFVNI